MKILISFCNQINESVNDNLVVLDTKTGERSFLLDYLSNRSITGITQDKKYLYACYQDSTDGLVVLDKNTLQLALIKALPEIKDAHSILVEKGVLYVVSTKHDKVISYDIDVRNKSVKYMGDFYLTAQSHFKKDLNHLNSLAIGNNDIYLSGLGLKDGSLWSTATNGFVRNLSKNYDLMTNLQHPHSITFDGNDIYYCESIEGTVKRNNETIINMKKGYTRGLAKKDNTLVVGSSAGRARSKSSNKLNTNSHSLIMHNICRVSIFIEIDGRYSLLNHFDFIDKYQEIYDLLILD